MLSIFIKLSFVIYLFLRCNISNFFDDSFPLIYISLTMKNGGTCPFIAKIVQTSNCSNWGIVALVNTLQCLTITFELSNNLHYIDNTCEGVHLVMDLIGMNFC
jgi:hypothetical protein